MAEKFSVRVPATCANLGCLFDCAALAVNLHLDLHVSPRNEGDVSLHYTGVNPERVADGPNNLVARVMEETLQSWGKKRGFAIEIHTRSRWVWVSDRAPRQLWAPWWPATGSWAGRSLMKNW